MQKLAWAARRRFLANICAVAPALLAVFSFGLAFFLPVYTDELAWKIIQSRMHLDDYANINLYPTCDRLAVPIPATLLPFRFVDSLLYEGLADPLTLRWSGLLVCAFGIVATCLLVARLQRGVVVWQLSTAVVLSFATIGVMPFLLVINRPEQVLAIAIVLFALPLIFDITPPKHTLAIDLLKGIALVVICSFVVVEHPRGLFALPLMLLFLFRFSSRRVVTCVAAGCIGIVAVEALRNLGVRTACSDLSLREIFIDDNFTFAVSVGELPTYLHRLFRAWLEDPLSQLYLTEFQFKSQFTSYIIPSAGGRLATVVRAVTTAAFACLLSAGLIAFLAGAYRCLQSQRVTTPFLALAALWAFWAVSTVARIRKNDYEAAVLMPVIVLASIGSLWVTRERIRTLIGPGRWRVLVRAACLGLLGLSLANQFTLLWSYIPQARGSWTDPGYPANQPFSVVPFGYDRLEPQILAAGAACGISTHERPRRLVVDELTYYAFRSSYQPLLATYIFEGGLGRHIRDHRQLLASVGSEGMVAGCQWIPSALRRDAKRSGQFCCLPSFTP